MIILHCPPPHRPGCPHTRAPLPALHSDTLRVRGRRSELEARLAEIDDAISRPKVFVKLDK